jgi:hypothetical protein
LHLNKAGIASHQKSMLAIKLCGIPYGGGGYGAPDLTAAAAALSITGSPLDFDVA